MNEVLNTLPAWENDSRLRDPLQANNQKLRNTRICNCFIVLVCTHMDVTLYLGGVGCLFLILLSDKARSLGYLIKSQPSRRRGHYRKRISGAIEEWSVATSLLKKLE